jgi:hypothetical protein
MSAILRKREIPTILAAFCGLVVIIDYYFVHGSAAFTSLTSEVVNIGGLISVFAVPIGAITIFIHFGRSINRREEEWWMKAMTLALVIFVPIIGFAGRFDILNWFMVWVEGSAHTTISGLAMFYYTIGAYRTFRLRNFEAFAIMIGGLIIMFMNAPLWGGFLTPWVTPLAVWCRDVAYGSVQRAIYLSTGIASVLMAVRVYLGIERGITGRQE